ncbi:MAG TPA: glycerol-3-phosphate 1-O-acyltransferase PlsY [Candidatus Saccharimonadales bacterium]|jgi:glycerol-3-phosphate acyltransferase PlsY|nr:glycerol-3-phosphate 1-O-acyltransferase PlsY [Candidatus Saccharimonadales bacterium]
MIIYVIVAAAGYLLGSVPFGYLLVKVFRGEDIRLSGSGNIGATNVARSARGLGMATLLLDAAKGMLAVLLAMFLAFKDDLCPTATSCPAAIYLISAGAAASVLGHMFPVWLRFQGGKGVATAMGAFALVFPRALLITVAIFIVVVLATRYVSLASILAAISFPIGVHWLNHPGWQTLLPIWAICGFIVIKHHQNIRRLLAGNESRFGSSKPSLPGSPA